ncbi:hypothetical protein ZWY2020_006067 [Hordeum vulgare]|nr:hypothetical protein ZWY2020_006067 [Hordeum vulgare]
MSRPPRPQLLRRPSYPVALDLASPRELLTSPPPHAGCTASGSPACRPLPRQQPSRQRRPHGCSRARVLAARLAVLSPVAMAVPLPEVLQVPDLLVSFLLLLLKLLLLCVVYSSLSCDVVVLRLPVLSWLKLS